MTEYKYDRTGYYVQTEIGKFRPLVVEDEKLTVDSPTLALRRAMMRQHNRRFVEPPPKRGKYQRRTNEK